MRRIPTPTVQLSDLPSQPQSVGESGLGFPDAPPSNRASGNCNRDPSFLLLRQAIDSLEVSYRGEWRPQIVKRLAKLKEAAQHPEPRVQALAQLVIDEDVFNVSDKGQPRYPFVLSNGRFRITLGQGRSMPVALVQIRSEYLANRGPVAALANAAAMVEKLASLDGGRDG